MQEALYPSHWGAVREPGCDGEFPSPYVALGATSALDLVHYHPRVDLAAHRGVDVHVEGLGGVKGQNQQAASYINLGVRPYNYVVHIVLTHIRYDVMGVAAQEITSKQHVLMSYKKTLPKHMFVCIFSI